jgi:hypothetical protein
VDYAVPEKTTNSITPPPPLSFSEPYCIYKTTVPLSVYSHFLPRTFLSLFDFSTSSFSLFSMFYLIQSALSRRIFSFTPPFACIFPPFVTTFNILSLSLFPAYSVFLSPPLLPLLYSYGQPASLFNFRERSCGSLTPRPSVHPSVCTLSPTES